MRRSGPGATGSGSSTRTSCAVVVRGRATNGTWMRCSSRSTAHSGTCGARPPARQRARHSGPVAPKRGDRKEVLPPTAQGPAVGAQGDRHRQARQLPGGAPQLLQSVTHRRSKYLDTAPRTPTAARRRESAIKRFTSIRRAQRFLRRSAASRRPFGPVGTCCRRPTTDRSWPTASRSATRSPGRRPRPPPESATGTGRFVQATAHHPESSHRPIRLAQVDSALGATTRRNGLGVRVVFRARPSARR